MSLETTRRGFLALAATAFVAACSGNDTSTGPNTSSGKTASTLRIALSTFGNEQLDPGLQGRSDALSILLPMYDTILGIAPDGSVAPGLAEKWELAPDNVTWTLNLRQGAQFHDGWGPLTADDVKFSLERWASEEGNSTGSEELRQKIARIDVPNPSTVQIVTNGLQIDLPYYLAPHENSSGIVFSKKYLTEKAGPSFAAQSDLLNAHPIGSGPYRFVSHQRGANLIFEAIDNHWSVHPAARRLEYLLVPEASTRLAMLKNHEADIADVTNDQVADLESSGLQVRSVPDAQNVGLLFVGTFRPVAKDKPTADPRVRQALAMAVDRDTILKTVLDGRGSVATTPWNTLDSSLDINVPHFAPWADQNKTYDIDGAKRLLAEAGYPDGFSGLKMHAFTRPGAAFLPQLAQIVVSEWDKIGVKAEIVPTDYGSYREHWHLAKIDDTYNAADATIYATAPRFDALGALNTYFRYDHGSVQLLKDTAVDESLDEVAATSDGTKRTDEVSTTFDHVDDQWVASPMFNVDGLYGVNPATVGEWQTYPGWPVIGGMVKTLKQ
jgi:peptide/nickel transport system substrate-binding protein